MRPLNSCLLLVLAAGWPGTTSAQLQLLPDREVQQVFAGEARKITLMWHNTGSKSAEADVHTRLYQASSATTVPLSEKPWKKIEILPGQTVLESASLDFPAVKAETRFLIQWLENTNRVLGKTEVLVYPTNLLKELKTLMGENGLAVLDPGNELKPLLKQNDVEFVDLGETSLEDFSGRLAIIGPFSTRTQMRPGLTQAIQKIAWKGAAVVWLQPPPDPKDPLKPSFYPVPEGKGTVVVAQPALVSDLPDNPRSQCNLIYLCRLAENPSLPALPDLSPPP